jgi:membrane protease YdiL (CAAX protease family)
MFRLVMVGGGVWLLTRVLGLPRWLAIVIAFAVSSVLFSAAHHIVGGEPWRLGAFTYRLLCGLFFATLFQTRGLAVAVYTHALYDIYVLIVRG